MTSPAPHVIPQRYEPAVPIDGLVEHPDNPRKGRQSVIEDSIEHNGFFGACLVQESTGYILVGNHRKKAAAAKGLTEVPVFYLDVDDETAMRIMLADNRANDLAGYGDAELRSLLEQLAATDSGLAGSGFDDADLADVIARLTPPSLDDLADQYGDDPTDEDRLVTVSLRLAPAVADRFRLRLQAMEQDTDTAKIAALLDSVASA